ncbi:glycosyl transferase family 2 [Enterococcus florum]|uniref:Glycosyl transferase family 2 n=1 Tax=Enterococcus florum TaxID=2480627 RepID=A0A4P5PKQ4_9ENTE|nr:glycosyltransferase [Enterococcus florum]GCF93913.1 glycosyl transferase family 2 [Enterococcus florum]
MNLRPSVSVIMPTYNGEKNILEQLDSIRQQTYPVEEVIILDDRSTDNTVSMVKEYIKKYNLTNWQVEENKKNLGWRLNFFCLLNKASGDIVFPSDQDDIWYLDKINKMVDFFLSHSTANVLVSNYDELIEFGGVSYPCSQRVIEKVTQEGRIPFTLKNIYLNRPGWVYAVRKSFLKEVKIFFDFGVVPVHDSAMWSVGVLTDSLFILREPTGQWRKHGQSAMRTEKKDETKKGLFGIRIRKLERLKEITISSIHYLEHSSASIPQKKDRAQILHKLIREYEIRSSIMEKRKIYLVFTNISKYTSLHPILADLWFLIKNK